MKYVTISAILFSIIALSAYSELTPTDLEKIREIVNESEKRTKEYIDLKIDNLEKSVNERFDIVDKRFDSVDKRMTLQAILTYGFMVFFAIAIGFPAWQAKKTDISKNR